MKVVFLDIDGVLNSHASLCADTQLYRAHCDWWVKYHKEIYESQGKRNSKSDDDLYKEAYEHYKSLIRDEYGHHFDKNCLSLLESIFISVPKLKFVISSSWRYVGLDAMKKMFDKRSSVISKDDILDVTYCMSHPFVNDITPFVNAVQEKEKSKGNEFFGRGCEIEGWMHWYNSKHSEDPITNYVILDDDCDMTDDQMSHFVQTSNENGLTIDTYKKVIEILSKE